MIGTYVIARTYSAGVFAGTLDVPAGTQGPGASGPLREAMRVTSLRIRQYRRLIRELSKPGPSPAPAGETGRGAVQSG